MCLHIVHPMNVNFELNEYETRLNNDAGGYFFGGH
jgi:hypothetical protein